MSRPLLSLPLLAASLTAQGDAPTFVTRPHLVRCVAEDVGKLLEQLPTTRVGKLLAEPEVHAAFTTALQRYRTMASRREQLVAAVLTRKLELDPWLLLQLPQQQAWRTVRQLDLADMQRVEFAAVSTSEEGQQPIPVAVLTCRPRAEGRWTALFEGHAKAMTTQGWRAEADAKFAGFPAYQFLYSPGEAADQGQAAGHAHGAPLELMRAWLLHLPGRFAFGSGTPDDCGTLAAPPARQTPHVVGEMNLVAYVDMFRRLMGGVPPEFAALGFDGLQVLRWRGQFVGDAILDEWEVELGDEPTGLVGALLVAKAKPPAQPLPDGALAQVRCAVDLPLLLQSLDQLAGGEAVPQALQTQLKKAFTGGVAVGVNAPAKGGLIPRLYASLAIADRDALQQLLATAFPPEVGRKQVTYEGTVCTVLTVPGLPAGLQPTFGEIDGVLHVAESGLSMRAFLKARTKGGDGMDVGDAPIPDGAGELQPHVDVRFDEQALYRTFVEVWLPLLKLVAAGDAFEPLLDEADMPSAEAVVPRLGKGRGVLRRQGNLFRLQQLGTLGGLESAAIAMTWGPFLSFTFHQDYTEDQLANLLARHQLTQVWAALETFQKANQRWPNDLAELFVAQKLSPDALLLAGDQAAEVVVMPAGDPRVVKSSFRYFKEPVQVDVEGNPRGMLLIGITPRRYNRPMLGVDGSLPDVWGADCTRPIDTFGK